MIVTVAEASEMWCPMVRHEGDVSSFNRSARNSNPTCADISSDTGKRTDTPIEEQKYGCHCVANKCMSWRWAPMEIHTTTVEGIGLVVSGSGPQVRRGYCGLAGAVIA